jgi:hypothetical protein
MTKKRNPRRTRHFAAAAALALIATACSSGSEGPAEVNAIDFGYENLPATLAAGSELTLTNSSTTELHELVAIKLPADETRSIEELVQLPPEELAAFFPGVATVLIAPPGEEAIAAVGDGSLDDPGRYLVVCLIPTGADPQEYLAAAAEAEGGPPEVDGGPPHLVHGMYGEINVEG